MSDSRYQTNPVYREEQKKRECERYQKRKEKLGHYWNEKWKNDSNWREKRKAINKKYRQSQQGKKSRSESAKRLRQFWRMKLFEVLGGPKCIQCGYDADHRALQFDHINGKGGEDRRKNPQTYLYFKNYAENPELAKQVFQPLCSNCNQIKKFDKKEM